MINHLDTPSFLYLHLVDSVAVFHAAATPKGVADLCLYILQCICKCMCIATSIKIFSLCNYRYIAITNIAVRVLSNNNNKDGDKINILGFVNIFLVKIFLT